MKCRVEMRAEQCLGEERAQVIVHLPVDLHERTEEIAQRIAGLMNEIQSEERE